VLVGGIVRKLVLVLIAFFAVITFIRAFTVVDDDNAAFTVEYKSSGIN
jgi:hypothetical protein